jgi:hypothetical protein
MLPVKTISKEQRFRWNALAKAVLVCAVLGVLGATVLALADDLVCSGRLGFRFCSTPLLATLAVAAIPLGVLRVLVVAELVLGTRYRVVLAVAAAFAFAVAVLLWARSPIQLATVYLVFNWTFVALYAGAMLRSQGRASGTLASYLALVLRAGRMLASQVRFTGR